MTTMVSTFYFERTHAQLSSRPIRRCNDGVLIVVHVPTYIRFPRLIIGPDVVLGVQLISIYVRVCVRRCWSLIALAAAFCCVPHPLHFASTMRPHSNEVCLTFSDPTKKICITIPTFEDVEQFFVTFHREISECHSNH